GHAEEPEEPGKPVLAVWALGPAIVLCGALLAPFYSDAAVVWSRLLIFCTVSAVVIGFSLALRRWWTTHPHDYVPDRPRRFGPDDLSTIRFTGHALALAALTIGGLGLIRSFTSMVVLGP